MNRFNTLLVAGALLAVPISSAAAGPCTAEIENVTNLMSARDAGAGPTTGAGGVGEQQPAKKRAEQLPTEIMGQALQGGAASAEDVRRQNRGGPTDAEQAAGVKRPAAAEALASAQTALEEARKYDGAGKEAECMDAVARAKRSLG